MKAEEEEEQEEEEEAAAALTHRENSLIYNSLVRRLQQKLLLSQVSVPGVLVGETLGTMVKVSSSQHLYQCLNMFKYVLH